MHDGALTKSRHKKQRIYHYGQSDKYSKRATNKFMQEIAHRYLQISEMMLLCVQEREMKLV